MHIPTGIWTVNQDGRDQDQNKKKAIEIVKQKLFKIEHDKYYEEQSARRKTQMGSSDRSDKIRTYNFPQDRITDHRLGMTKFGIPAFLSGNMVEDFVDAYKQHLYEIKVEELLQQQTTSEDQTSQSEAKNKGGKKK